MIRAQPDALIQVQPHDLLPRKSSEAIRASIVESCEAPVAKTTPSIPRPGSGHGSSEPLPFAAA